MAQTRASEGTSTARDDPPPSWTDTFHENEQNIFFCCVEYSFLKDKFELHGLGKKIKNYHYAMDLILDETMSTYQAMTTEQKQEIEEDAKILYGLIHSRYILTRKGLEQMRMKYKNKEFGVCMRHFCNNQALLPVGLSTEINTGFVRLYCPSCEDIYRPKNDKFAKIDGAYFGPTFANLLLLQCPLLKPYCQKMCSSHAYVPTIYGFRLHSSWHQVAMKAHDLDIDVKEDDDNDKVLYLLNTVQKQTNQIAKLEHELREKQKECKRLKQV